MPEPDRLDPKILEVHILTEIIGVYFIGTIVPIKYMPIISAVGLLCFDKFEEKPKEKVFNIFSECHS